MFGGWRGAYRLLGGDKPKIKKPLGYLDVDGITILKCIFKKWEWRRGTDLPRSS
jgi:hypothetical protein